MDVPFLKTFKFRWNGALSKLDLVKDVSAHCKGMTFKEAFKCKLFYEIE